jgi:thioester reductase-like protein
MKLATGARWSAAMPDREGILLTGATGLLGRYLLRDLLAARFPVTVLARDNVHGKAEEHIREIVEFGTDTLKRRLPKPTIITGDLRHVRLGLNVTDRAWVARHCRSVVHAAASLSFRGTPEGEPWLTNTKGTARLLKLSSKLGIRDFHHISSAFVCGDLPGPILESTLCENQQFHDDYERSKNAAEELIRNQIEVRGTIYRPSVIVGDSQTGFTSSYHGLYRFLELADRLAEKRESSSKRALPLRLAFTGDEPRDFVPVDWVAQAIARIVSEPKLHGKTYHLTASRPVLVRDIKSVAETELEIEGVRLIGNNPVSNPSDLENAFWKGLREYWPYWCGDPVFNRRNLVTALPELPAPQMDRNLLARLVRFAVENRFGRSQRRAEELKDVDCGAYFEKFFPEAMSRSVLASLSIEITLGISISGPSGGRWVCRFKGGRVLDVSRSSTETAELEYRMDSHTFTAIVTAQVAPHAAFFDRRVEIVGDVEGGLQMAVLFGQFASEFPYKPERIRELQNTVLA